MRALTIILFIMKNFFSFCIIAVFALFLSSCTEDAITSTAELPNEFAELQEFNANTDLSVFDVRARSITETKFVKEVVLINHANAARLPGSINFKGEQMLDNGVGNDAIADDGIYTSLESYDFANFKIAYDAAEPVQSVLSSPIVHPDFEYQNKLISASQTYDIREFSEAKIISVTCDVTFGCGGCRADRWGWCDNCCVCVDTDSCSVTVGF